MTKLDVVQAGLRRCGSSLQVYFVIWEGEVVTILLVFLAAPRFKEVLAKNNLKVILMVFTEGAVAPGEVRPLSSPPLRQGLAFGGPYPGFTTPSQPGESDKERLVATHLQVGGRNKGRVGIGAGV